MKCDSCEKEATVHELLPSKGGKIVEKHLCEQCAREAGVAVQTHLPLTQLLSQFLTTQAKAAAGAAPAPGTTTVQPGVCRTCGVSYAQFRHSGLLGCPDCYRSFETQLSPLLERAHEGGTHHVGKVPRYLQAPGGATPPIAEPAVSHPAPTQSPATPLTYVPPNNPVPAAKPIPVAKPTSAQAKPVDLRLRLQALRKQLNDAVAAEQYEKAAKIRDELSRLEGKPPGPTGERKSEKPGEKP